MSHSPAKSILPSGHHEETTFSRSFSFNSCSSQDLRNGSSSSTDECTQMDDETFANLCRRTSQSTSSLIDESNNNRLQLAKIDDSVVMTVETNLESFTSFSDYLTPRTQEYNPFPINSFKSISNNNFNESQRFQPPPPPIIRDKSNLSGHINTEVVMVSKPLLTQALQHFDGIPLEPVTVSGSPPQHIVGMVTGLKRSSDESETFEAKHRHLLEFHPHSRLVTDFELMNVLGTGTFGTVYRARSKLDDVMYAIKRSRRRFHGIEDKNKMMHEVHALAAIAAADDSESSSTIVRYYNSWIEDDYICIQMELCDISLEALILPPRQLDEKDAFSVLRDTLLALKILHRNDYVHLDIKPANIFKKGTRYHLGDFGLAVHTENGHASANKIEEGDGRYMARELLDWDAPSDLTKCDIFSLGVTAYEIVSRVEAPLNGPIFHELRSGTLPHPPHGISAEMLEILQHMMAPAPKDRPTAQNCLDQYLALKSDVEKELYYQRLQVESLMRELETQTDNSQKSLIKRCNTR